MEALYEITIKKTIHMCLRKLQLFPGKIRKKIFIQLSTTESKCIFDYQEAKQHHVGYVEMPHSPLAVHNFQGTHYTLTRGFNTTP